MGPGGTVGTRSVGGRGDREKPSADVPDQHGRILKSFRRLMRDYLHPAERGQSLCALLRRALVDT